MVLKRCSPQSIPFIDHSVPLPADLSALSSIFLTCCPTANVAQVKTRIPGTAARSHLIRCNLITYSAYIGSLRDIFDWIDFNGGIFRANICEARRCGDGNPDACGNDMAGRAAGREASQRGWQSVAQCGERGE